MIDDLRKDADLDLDFERVSSIYIYLPSVLPSKCTWTEASFYYILGSFSVSLLSYTLRVERASFGKVELRFTSG
jgi:hypothetical protein